MEDGRVDALPPPAYTSGFLRSYARALGLDGDALAAAYRAALGEQALRAELRFPEPIADSRLPGGGAMAAGLAGLALIYVGWIHDFSGDLSESATQVTEVPERLSVIADARATPVMIPEQADAGEAADRRAAPETVADVVEGDPETTAAGQAGSITPAETIPATGDAPALTGQAGGEHSSRNYSSATDASPQSDRVTLTAAWDSWLYIVDSMKREVWAGVLREGESWSPDREGLILMTSNAGGVLVSVGDRPARPLGEKGAVLRDLPLDANKLSDRQGG